MKISVKMISREFVCKVGRGTKRMTIRPERKVPHEIGDVLELRGWTGRPYWSRQYHIGFARVVAYYRIVIRPEGFEMDGVFTPRQVDLARLAKSDGFPSWAALISWFGARYDLPFVGFVTAWKPIHGSIEDYAELVRGSALASSKGAL